MGISSRLLSHRIWQRLRTVKTLSKESERTFAALSEAQKYTERNNKSNEEQFGNTINSSDTDLTKYRFIYPEFLPDPNMLHRNALREKLERMDMLARRSRIVIPEFYVGSILAVTISEPHAPTKHNKFVGICIHREGCGLRATFVLRNVVDGMGVEVLYNMYDPTIQSIECLRLEKRLDDKLFYLRDAPLEYSTFPFDMEPTILPEGKPVPVNKIKVPLKPPPWLEKWERQNLKGVQDLQLNERRQRRANIVAKQLAYEKYDLMKIYRATIPEEEQEQIYGDIYPQIRQLDEERLKDQRKRNIK